MATEAQDFFKHCAPVINTSLARCGALSICENTLPETLEDLESNYRTGDDWKIIGDLLMTNFELKATSCGIRQHGFRDFLVSNIKNVKRMLSPDNFDAVNKRLRPYLLADQKIPINNVYWYASGGAVANSTNWALNIKSLSGIPADVRSFQVGERLWVESATEGGSLNNWQGVTVDSDSVGDHVRVELTPQNDNSYFDNVENPVSGIVRRGPPVVGQYEQYCSNEPAYLNTVTKDYWVQWSRDTFCDNELTREFFDYVLKKNPLYKKFFHLPKIQEANQRLEAFWDKMFNNFMWSRPSNVNQNLNDFPNLPKQNVFLSEDGIGFGGGQCVGYVAENVGWMEQWQRCKSIVDLQGDTLNMWSIIDLVYDLVRVRFQTGSPATVRVTAFADRSTAELLDRGFIALQNYRTDDTFRITMDVTGQNKPSNPFGFQFRSYALPGKGYGIILDVITDYAFDDYISEWSNLNNEDMGRNLWFLDPTNFYAGVVHSERTDNRGGSIADMAKVHNDFQCVQKTVTQDTAILGVAFASIVECAQRDRLLRNFSGDPPSVVEANRPQYTLTTSPYSYSPY